MDFNPEETRLEDILAFGRGLCSGYVPYTNPGLYMELWEYQSYIYMITVEPMQTKVHPIGVAWGQKQ